MLEIPTARGLPILADDEDEELIAPYSWCAVSSGTGGRFYAQARVRGSGPRRLRVHMHRLIMQPLPGHIVHHINNNGLDNRRTNLAVVTYPQNLAAHHHARPSGTYAVDGRHRALLRLNKRRISLGSYVDARTAQAVVDVARLLLFNIPEAELPIWIARIKQNVGMAQLRSPVPPPEESIDGLAVD